MVDERNSYAAGSAIFDTNGHLVGVGPGGTEAIRFDHAGRKYVFRSTGDWSQAAALTMYAPTGMLLPGPLGLPADKVTLPRVPAVLAGAATEGAFVEATPALHSWSVDDSGNFYCYGASRKNIPVDLGGGRVISCDLLVFKFDPAGHLLARSSPLPENPEDAHYEPQVDSTGRAYYLEFHPDRVEVMRGAFSP